MDMIKIKSKKELESVLYEIDMEELHRRIALIDSGWTVWLYWDGENVHMDNHTRNTYPAPGCVCFAIIPCDGNNISHQYYAEGWASMNEEGDWLTDDGRILTDHEMIEECIIEGDHTDMYDNIRDIIRETYNYE